MADANVVQFPTVDTGNIPATLRWYAQAIEDGKMAPESVIVLLTYGPRALPGICVAGRDLDRVEMIGHLATAQAHATGVAFR